VANQIDRDSAIPAYHQVILGLEQRISSGEWNLGERLPSEVALAKDYDVSRMTIRQALTELEKDGIIIRRRPTGTFLARIPRKLAPTLSIPVSLLQGLNSQGYTSAISTDFIGVSDVLSADIAELLQLNSTAKTIQINRSITVNKTLVARVQSVIPHARCPGLEDIPLKNNSIHETIEEHFGITIVRANHWIESIIAKHDEIPLLKDTMAGAMLKLTSVYEDQDATPVEYVLTYWLGDMMTLHLQTERAAHAHFRH